MLNLDFAETFLDYAGAKAPADMQGRSFRPILEGHTPKDWRTVDVLPLLDAPWRDHGVPAHYGVRTKQYKLIYYYGKALGSAGAIDKRYRARVGAVRSAKGSARDEQRLRRSEVPARS